MCKNPGDEEWFNQDPESILSFVLFCFFNRGKIALAFLEFVARGPHELFKRHFFHIA